MQVIRPVLAISDLSPSGTNAAWRAALVARDHGVPLRLLHAQPAAAGLPAAHAALGRLAAEIHERIGIDVAVQVTQGDTLGEAACAAAFAQLLVIGARRGNRLREWMLGTQAERLVRQGGVPVLVVRRTAQAAYRRVLVAVDLGPAAGDVVAGAARFSRGPRMEVLHALGTRNALTMRASGVREPVARSLREGAARRARAALEEVIAFSGTRTQGVVPSIGYGPPAWLVLSREHALRAELVVVGKRPRGPLADFFLGSVSRQVLAGARADVLVLPPAPQPRRSDFRDQLDLDAGAGRDLRHAEGTARVRAGRAEHLAEQFAGAVHHQVVFGERAR